jgi:hypothetical protein
MGCVSGGSAVAMEAEQRQQGHFGAVKVGSAAAALATCGAAGRQDIGGSGYSRAVAAAAARQRGRVEAAAWRQ